MSKIKALVEVEGVKPLLFHTFPMDTFSSDKKKEGKTGDNKSEWKSTVLMDDKRQLYVMNTYFQASIADGGKEIKSGRGNISKKVASTLEVVENRIFLNGLTVPDEENLMSVDTDPVYLDVRAVVNPMTKGRNLRYRIAAKSGWKCSFHISWEDCICSKEQIKQCVENGGMYQGVGDGRALGFGRYKLLSFKVVA